MQSINREMTLGVTMMIVKQVERLAKSAILCIALIWSCPVTANGNDGARSVEYQALLSVLEKGEHLGSAIAVERTMTAAALGIRLRVPDLLLYNIEEQRLAADTIYKDFKLAKDTLLEQTEATTLNHPRIK